MYQKRVEVNEFEQKPVKIDLSDEEKETQIQKKLEEKRAKRKKYAEKAKEQRREASYIYVPFYRK